jgi:hypothetical protein
MIDYRDYADLNDNHRFDGAAPYGLDELGIVVRGLPRPIRRPIDKAIGTVGQVVSLTLGRPAARRVRQQARSALGQADCAYLDIRGRLDRELTSQPYRSLLMAVGAGVVLGLMLARRERTITYRPSR